MCFKAVRVNYANFYCQQWTRWPVYNDSTVKNKLAALRIIFVRFGSHDNSLYQGFRSCALKCGKIRPIFKAVTPSAFPNTLGRHEKRNKCAMQALFMGYVTPVMLRKTQYGCSSVPPLIVSYTNGNLDRTWVLIMYRIAYPYGGRSPNIGAGWHTFEQRLTRSGNHIAHIINRMAFTIQPFDWVLSFSRATLLFSSRT